MIISRAIKRICFLSILVCSLFSPLVAEESHTTSKWGPDDTIGSANYLTPELARKAATLVTEGKVYSLGIAVGPDTPAVAPRTMAVNILMPGQYGGVTFGSNKASYLDDMITGWVGIGTQIDGLAHAGHDGTFYNGNKSIDFVTPSGVKKLSAADIPPIVTRGILLDVAKFRGVKRLKEGEVISAEEMEQIAKAQGVAIREGDVVIFHTGWLSLLDQDPERFSAGEPGLDRAGAEFLASKNIVAVGADTWGIDAVPFKDDSFFDVHVTLLYEHGTYLLEAIDTRKLAADGVYEFMFVLGQPKYVGSVQAMINPIAIK